MTDYNQWYTMTSDDKTTVLVSNFVYKINNLSTLASNSSLASELGNLKPQHSTGDKLCYASSTTGNVITVLLSSRPTLGRTFLFGGSGSSWSSTGLSISSRRQTLLPSSMQTSSHRIHGLHGLSTQ